MNNGKLFLFPKIWKYNIKEFERYLNKKNIYLSFFEEYYLKRLILFNVEKYGNEWNKTERELITLLYRLFKNLYIQKNKYYNSFYLIKEFEKYLTHYSKIKGVVKQLEY